MGLNLAEGVAQPEAHVGCYLFVPDNKMLKSANNRGLPKDGEEIIVFLPASASMQLPCDVCANYLT